jgi:hypothetical protein
MPRQSHASWGKPVVRLRLNIGISAALLAIVIKFNDILHNLLALFTGLILYFSHLPKVCISSVKNIVIPIFHTTYNKEQQFKLVSY